jgi:hypothetical protein
MHPVRPHGLHALALAAIALTPAACSLLLNHDAKQCSTSEDCKRFQANAICLDEVCVDPSQLDGGSDGGLGPPGCFTGVPTTDVEFFNACTTASYLKFDNCTRASVCDSTDPSLTKPDAGGATPTQPLDGGPSVSCYDPADRQSVIFMNGSTNFTPFIRAMVPIVAESGFTIVWQPTSSCTGADTIFNSDPSRRVMRNPTNTSQSYAAFYTRDNLPNGTPCLLGGSPTSPAAGQEIVDIGQSDIYATTCPVTSGSPPFNTYVPGQGIYSDVRHYLGPVQTMVFVVPAGSSQRVISAEAARLVFGLGGNRQAVAPWTDPSYMWIRSATTGTTGIIARGIGVPSTDWWGVDQRTAPNMVTQIKSVSTNDSERTIGTLSIDFADREKDNLHLLYFQPRGALAGFLPDLHRFTRDKENVRDGHYPLWGPIHLYSRASGGDISAGAKAFITEFSVPRPEQALLDATIETGNVPGCAMKVTRDTEMGPLRAYEPPFQCHCYYEKKLNGGNDCKACAGPADCTSARPACNLGYCERQ